MRIVTILALLIVWSLLSAAIAAAEADEIPVRMLAPGFTVRELPVKLTNINNLEYMPDGRLLALGYDGRVHLLRDTDGDGLEDQATVWWSNPKSPFRGPIGTALAPEGLYVASKGKLSLLKDTNGDDVADVEEIVTSGWKEVFTAVDCVGVARDAEGNLYIGRGCANFADAYQLDKEGKSQYDINSEYGTILKVSADRSKREVVATGVRFSVGIAINRHGDLFFTDQEGDTWTKGNHLDELNVLLPGRKHYGFPERHPVHLPEVVDTDPLVSFGPQHQSTCGFVFNESSARRKRFGPASWEGDAIVTGESRGKLWRVPLVKTPNGYVGGRPITIARLGMLTVGVTISPDGDLVVCCHSGKPDWGTGPNGIGRVFKIRYTGTDEPQPVMAWPSGDRQVKLAFDRPVDPSILAQAPGILMQAGEYVRAADRYETLKPPYEVVREQLAAGWRNVKVESAALSEDGRTLTLATEKLPWNAWYSLAVPGVMKPGASGSVGTTVDLDFDLSGVAAEWTSADAQKRWKGWLPHSDPLVVRALTLGSAEHEAFLKLLDEPGNLTVHWKDRSGAAKTVQHRTGPAAPIASGAASSEVFLLPLAPADRQPLQAAKEASEFTQAGDWERGKVLFHGDAKCGTCHTVRGEGGRIGPDLSNLVHLSPEAVLKDIVEPNAALNPDHVNYLVKLKDGRVLSGLVYGEAADTFRIIESAEKAEVVSRSSVVSMKASTVSLMPEGYGELGEQKLKDLLRFLTEEK